MKSQQFGLNQLSVNTISLAESAVELATQVAWIVERFAAKKIANLMAKGWDKNLAVDEALKTTKGNIAECMAVIDLNRQAKFLGINFEARMNPVSNDPLHDVQFLVGNEVVDGVQLKVGSAAYVRKAIESGKYGLVVANQEAVEELNHLYSNDQLDNAISFQGVRGTPLSEEEAIQIGRKSLLEHNPSFLQQSCQLIANEVYHVAHNTLHNFVYGLAINSVVSYMTSEKGSIDWDDVTDATQSMVERAIRHYSLSRSLSLVIQSVAINSPGSVFGRAAQALLRRGHWISAGLSAGLSIWDNLQAHNEGKLSKRELYGQNGEAVGKGAGAAAAGLAMLELTKGAHPLVQLGALCVGGYLGSELGGGISREVGLTIHDWLNPEETPLEPYLLHAPR